MSKVWKALVHEKETGRAVIIESVYETKMAFVTDLRANGYAVDVARVRLANEFDYIIKYTNCSANDWRIFCKY